MAKKNKNLQKPGIRSPICTTLGHVDHGKSTLLDTIRGSSIVNSEAGQITQEIGASIVPMNIIRKICGNLLDTLNLKFTIPGLLFIDTPGHEAFTSLRKRGGNLADIAILVVDINEGFKPQTIEALEILKRSKTPFVVAANKIDLISGFRNFGGPLIKNINHQQEQVINTIENQLYEIVGKLAEFGFESERFDRLDDFTKQIAIIPISARSNIGIAELLMILSGLAQKYLQENLKFNLDNDAKAIILEVKEEKGLGLTLDVIVYDGNIKVGDTVVIGSIHKPIITKVKALLEPAPLVEIRDKKARFKSVKQVYAATGVKIAAQNIDDAIAGMPLRGANKENLESIKKEIQEEIKEVLIETDSEGIIIKADSLGSLEALTLILKEKDIKIRRAAIGDISKKDLIDAKADKERLNHVILGFNVKLDAPIDGEVKTITNKVIYKLVEDFEKWVEDQKELEKKEEFEGLPKLAKFRIIEGYVFRQSNPAVVGIEVITGNLKSNSGVMNKEGKEIAKLKGIQHEQKNIEVAEKGKQVAVSLEGATVGRQIKEGDVLYTYINEEIFKKFKELKKYLLPEELDLLKEIAEIQRKKNPVWGI